MPISVAGTFGSIAIDAVDALDAVDAAIFNADFFITVPFIGANADESYSITK